MFDAGDDAICIKSGKDEDGRRRGEPCQNVIVKNNVVLHGHGGFVVGSEMSGGVKIFMCPIVPSLEQMLVCGLRVQEAVEEWWRTFISIISI